MPFLQSADILNCNQGLKQNSRHVSMERGANEFGASLAWRANRRVVRETGAVVAVGDGTTTGSATTSISTLSFRGIVAINLQTGQRNSGQGLPGSQTGFTVLRGPRSGRVQDRVRNTAELRASLSWLADRIDASLPKLNRRGRRHRGWLDGVKSRDLTSLEWWSRPNQSGINNTDGRKCAYREELHLELL